MRPYQPKEERGDSSHADPLLPTLAHSARGQTICNHCFAQSVSKTDRFSCPQDGFTVAKRSSNWYCSTPKENCKCRRSWLYRGKVAKRGFENYSIIPWTAATTSRIWSLTLFVNYQFYALRRKHYHPTTRPAIIQEVGPNKGILKPQPVSKALRNNLLLLPFRDLDNL